MNLTIAELARAVNKSENYVRQHIYRQHLTVSQDGRNVSVTLSEAVRWARERGLSFDSPVVASLTVRDKTTRTARMTVLIWHAPGERSCNLFTLVRHRRQDSLGPWASKPNETWSCGDFGHELWLFSFDASLEHCQALVDHILDSGTLEINGITIHYALEPVPRRHWAYRDCRPLVEEASMSSPFSRHSAQIIEYWSFAAEPRKYWLEALESCSNSLLTQFTRLCFPLDRRPDRVGNLMIAGAEDTITCDLTVHHDRTLNFHVDAKELLPGAYRATIWASHSDDNVLRREITVNSGSTQVELSSDVDRIGFSIHRTVDGQCVDLMDVFLVMEVGIRMEINSGPTLHLHDRRGQSIHKVTPAGHVTEVNVRFDKDSAELDKEIRRQWLDRRIYEQEAAARKEGNFVRFRPDEFDQAIRYFIGLLRRDSDQTTPIYLADPYFMSQLKGADAAKLYLDVFAATVGQPLRILCTQKDNDDAQPWWSKYPKQITAHIKARSFLEHDEQKRAFHDRYLVTPKRSIIITHSFTGWPKHGVTFASLPYDVYRTEAKRLWSMEVGSMAADLLVREIS